MAPWAQIAKPFSIYFTVNCVKTVLGAGFVGYGIAMAMKSGEEGGSEWDVESGSNDDKSKAVTNTGAHDRRVVKYVKVAATIGFGLFLSLPSLATQIVWETMIPSLTATDIAYETGKENVRAMIPDLPKTPRFKQSLEQILDEAKNLVDKKSGSTNSSSNGGSS